MIKVENNQIDLSLRPSDIAAAEKKSPIPARLTFSDYSVGDSVHGYVSNTDKKKGCFIKLNKDVVARVLITNLSDSYIKDVERVFRVGKLVTGKVTQVDTSASRMELSLKTSAVVASTKVSSPCI